MRFKLLTHYQLASLVDSRLHRKVKPKNLLSHRVKLANTILEHIKENTPILSTEEKSRVLTNHDADMLRGIISHRMR